MWAWLTPVVEIRRALPGDGPAIAEVRRESWRAAYAGLMPDELLAGMSADGEAWERAISSERADTGLLVVDDGGIRGFSTHGPDRAGAPHTGEIAAIYLHPDVWGRGWGRALIGAAEADLVSFGFDRAVLWVLSTNDRARGFYERLGWTDDEVEKIEEWDGHPLPHARYSRELSRPGDAP